MRFTYLALLLTETATAMTLGKRATCAPIGTKTTDKFDDVKVIPALPMVNAILGPTPTGTYLTYNNAIYANVGNLSNVVPPSPPNDISLPGRQNNVYLTPTFKGANAFGLTKFRYACVAMTALTVLEIAPKCSFEFTCTVFGGGTRSKTFTFVPDSLLTSSYNTGTFPSDFTGLTRCNVRLTSASVAGLIDSAAAVPLTILAIDDVENEGQKCG